ncbi:MAG: hypothetical protein GWQ05_14150 [Verrucomicrobiaceae bacterium]|nr:hypothetical protein [Verrucomicrobiaceae bacterium]NCF92080.1 hypothetical protein [Verrucomicrobiaceae bacterium]
MVKLSILLSLLLLSLPLSAQEATTQEATTLFEERSVVYTGGEYENKTFGYRLLKPETIEEGNEVPPN